MASRALKLPTERSFGYVKNAYGLGGRQPSEAAFGSQYDSMAAV